VTFASNDPALFLVFKKGEEPKMQPTRRRWLRPIALLLSLTLLAAACGDDDESTTSSDTSSDSSSTSDSGGESDASTESEGPAPLRVGLIAQDEELLAFPEVRAAAEAFVSYFNDELDGAGGHPIELDICGAGDAPESHVACAQQFANDDSILMVLSGGFLSNSAAASEVLVGAEVPIITLGNDFIDYLTPGSYTFDPGLPGLAQVFFVFAAGQGLQTATLFIADDPAFEPFIPALEAIAESNGITITEVVPLGFEPDLTGPVSAADTSNEMWLFVLADGSQCSASAAAVATVGFEGRNFANDLCMAESVVSSGDLDGWAGPVVSKAPVVDGGDDVALINRVLDEYGPSDAQNAGLAGWAVGNMYVIRDVLAEAGADATRASVMELLGSYSNDSIPGMGPVSCPGPSAWVGACNMAPLMVTVADGQLTSPDGFIQLDFAELDFLLG